MAQKLRHLVLLRTWVRFLTPTWWLTTISKSSSSSSKGSHFGTNIHTGRQSKLA